MSKPTRGRSRSPVSRGEHDDQIRALYERGYTHAEIAERVCSNRTTVSYRIKALELTRPAGPPRRPRIITRRGKLKSGAYDKAAYDPHKRLAADILAPLCEVAKYEPDSNEGRLARTQLRWAMGTIELNIIGACITILDVERQVAEILTKEE